ncbi:hypothetical protein [Micromonospora sp. WMMD710]|nr:hypothetical protein [Micromonospora sp. WMMD710]MDG4761136.1 hypothetical protein [Micromonospora sp. WMMD710]
MTTVKSQCHAALRRLREVAPDLALDARPGGGAATTGVEVNP